jgi:murein DD-endopeptidase MepM/ murein hydrolase activator NlpD
VSALGWIAGVTLGGLVVLAGSMVRIVPADTVPPAQAPAAIPSPVQGAQHPLLTVPVQGVQRSAIADTWGQSRANGARAHQAVDIMAPGGTPVVAAAPGTVEKLYFSNGGGGITVYVRSPDKAWSYYYAHLQGYAPGLHEGQGVAAGELLGFVGDTGNAGTGNFHLHFAIARMKPGDHWYQGEPVNPYPLLAASAPAR